MIYHNLHVNRKAVPDVDTYMQRIIDFVMD